MKKLKYDPNVHTLPEVVEDVDRRLDRLERALREYLGEAGTGEFFAREMALRILDTEE